MDDRHASIPSEASPRHAPPGRQPQARRKAPHGEDGMVAMARANERAHLAPAPGAEPPSRRPFPAIIGWGLLGGILIGAAAGWLFARLLLNGTLVIPGWEQLYSMAPGTFYTFWVGLGIAAGIILGGVGTILATPDSSDHNDRPKGDDDHAGRGGRELRTGKGGDRDAVTR